MSCLCFSNHFPGCPRKYNSPETDDKGPIFTPNKRKQLKLHRDAIFPLLQGQNPKSMAMVGEQDAVRSPSGHTQVPKEILKVEMEEGASVSPSPLATPALSTGQHCLSKNKDTPTELIWKDL